MRCQRLGVGEIIAVMMGDRRADDLAGRIAPGEGGVGVGHLQLHLAADEFQRGVAHQRAGQQAGLDQDLEAVADADDQHALCAFSATARITGMRAAIAPQRR